MSVLFPTSIGEALSALAEPDVEVLAGGTDFMVEVNAGRRRPETVLSLRRVPELRTWQRVAGPDGPAVRLGATVTYTDLLEPSLAELLPALAHAARTVGSPPIRNAGTIGGNVATASPAGDTLPVLAALEAVVEVLGPGGGRHIPVATFITGPKRNALQPGELIVAVLVPILEGHQEFRKVGVRNAMVIAVASMALALDTRSRTVRCALGSVGPGPIRARQAEAWLAAAIDWDHLPGQPGPPGRPGQPAGTGGGGATGGVEGGGATRGAGGRHDLDLAHFGRLVSQAAQPIDDHRGTAAYRRHAVGVLARRAAAQALGASTGAAA